MFLRARWLVVIGGIVVVALVELLSDSVLDPLLPFPLDTLAVVAVMAAVASLGAALAFRRLDAMESVLRERNAELESSDASIRALHRVSMSLSTLTDVDALLRAVVESARDLLDADVAMLVLMRSDATPRLAATSGPADAFSLTGSFEGADFRRFVRPELLHVVLAAPIQRGSASIGTLAVGARTPRTYGVSAVETMASLASQAAIAIENDRLMGQLRELAVRSERERIAREMHDGLAQVLGYVNTKSQAVEELLAAGRVDSARTQLRELAAAARSVYVDVREAILGLTSPIAPERGLVGAVEEYARRFSEASKLVVVVDASDATSDVRLTPEAQAQTFRILQEALTNVRKHAAAHRVRVSLDVADDQLQLRVDDDGRGMLDVGEPGGWPRYGLISMRERAAGMGGSIELTPQAHGTRVELRVPLTAVELVA